jgi:hypothetical protein
MSTRRVYLPLTHEQVRRLADERRLAAPVQGWSAGSPGRVDARISPAGAEEEAEYQAFRAAADHAVGHEEGERRVIASADASEEAIREVAGTASGAPSGPVAVVVAEDLPLRRIASLHIDEAAPETAEESEAGVAEVTEASEDEVDAPTEDGPSTGTEPDLLWYDITELDTVLAELDS